MSLEVPVLALGGGGYNITTVPRMWALTFSRLFEVELPDACPETYGFRDRIPALRDEEEPPVAPHDRQQAERHAEQTIAEVQERLFAHHGL